MSRRWRKHHRQEVVELNITAFMNLMVILVPFLLITAVFSQVAILELNLPSSAEQLDADPDRPMQLEIVVRRNRLEVAEASAGMLTALPMKAGGYDLDGLNSFLKRIKAKYPDKLDATILLEQEVPYDVLVKVMDAVRVYEAQGAQTGRTVQAELFPEISIGDATAVKGGA